MSEPTKKHVCIVGAGIVGVSSAIWLQRAGHKVTLIDREGPAAGTSYGNAGVLAACAVVPVTVPGLLKKAPKMLLDPNSPLFLRWGYLPKLLPWLRKYLKHCDPGETARIAKALTPILGDSLAQHQALVEGTEADRWLHPGHYMFAYQSRENFEAEHFVWNLRKLNGFEWEELSQEQILTAEPCFGNNIGFGIRLDNHGRISDPGAYVKSLANHVEKQGGKSVRATISDFTHNESGKVSGVVTADGTIDCDAVVIATGVWSGPLADKLGIHVPMESERGYHIELTNPSKAPSVPVMIASGKFVATPMDGRLRCAGVVEFGGLKAPASENPVELLKKQIHEAMPGIKYDHVEEWMGHRPAPSDSIPVIGEFEKIRGVYGAFGHQHVGLTGGPKTGRIVADLISGEASKLDLEPYSPARFR